MNEEESHNNIVTERRVVEKEDFVEDEFSTEGAAKSWLEDFSNILSVSIVTIGFLLIGWYGYTLYSKPRDISELTLIKKDTSPTKVKPVDPGGMVVPNMDKMVYNTLSSKTAEQLPKVERILPLPEQPINRENLVESKIQEVTTTLSAQVDDFNQAAPVVLENQGLVTHDPEPQPAPSPKPKKSVPSKAVVIKKVPDSEAKLANNKIQKNKNAKFKVQLASLRSKKEAQKEWEKVKKNHAQLAMKYNYTIEQKQLSNGTFYRLQLTGINTDKEANSVCKALYGSRKNCLIVKEAK
jgi:hypothetical protein